MTDQEWKQVYQNMTNDDFTALLQQHRARLDEDEERIGSCIDCGAKISVMRKYVVAPNQQAVYLGRFRDPCDC